MLKDMDFYHLQENKQLLDTGLDAVKTVSKKVARKASEFLGNETTDAATKSNNDKIVKPDKNPRNVEEMINLPEIRNGIINKLRQLL